MGKVTNLERQASALNKEARRIISALRLTRMQTYASRHYNRQVRYELEQEVKRAKRLQEESIRLCKSAEMQDSVEPLNKDILRKSSELTQQLQDLMWRSDEAMNISQALLDKARKPHH